MSSHQASIFNGTLINETVAVAKEFIETPFAGNLTLFFACLASAIAFFNMFAHLNNYTRAKLQKFTVGAGTGVTLGRLGLVVCAGTAPGGGFLLG